MSQPVIIDANRIFSELIASNHKLRRVFASEPEVLFVCPKYVLVELFKHKERIASATGLAAHLAGENPFFRRRRHQHWQLDGGMAVVPQGGRKRRCLRGPDLGTGRSVVDQ